MKNWEFRHWNRGIAFLVALLSFVLYLLTMEPYFGFWDIGEYIPSAAKLEVTHAPGAAFFQLFGAALSIFNFGNNEWSAIIINGMSCLFSGITIYFTFQIIVHLGLKAMKWDSLNPTKEQRIAGFIAAAAGSLIFAVSDTFWYNAVEGEVYSMASLFVSLIIWLMVQWDRSMDIEDKNKAKNPAITTKNSSLRWVILLFFVAGLSVGIHMMCLLAVPAACLLYYSRREKFEWKSFIIANAVTLVVLIILYKFIFPFVMMLFGELEIFAVNYLSLPFHSGTLIASILLIAILYFLNKISFTTRNHLAKTATLSFTFLLIGFLCWMVIPIRANANPPMNLNNPDNALSMRDYYNREQYGDWPTFYGQNYTAYLDNAGMKKDENGNTKTISRGNIYEKNEKTKRYERVGEHFSYEYDDRHVGFFPRMYQGMGNEGKSIMANYISMYGAPDFELNTDNENINGNPDAEKMFLHLKQKAADGTITVQDFLDAKEYDLLRVHKPTLGQNISYFFGFQLNHYFLRYLAWNFVGRQNDMEGQMQITRGNWQSGIPFIDNLHLGDSENMPAKYKNESSASYYFLPFILGLIGLFFQAFQDFKRFYAMLALFILSSVGIIFYTSVKPFEPRERDYAMVGSFFVFALWTGLGVLSIYNFLISKIKQKNLRSAWLLPFMGIPILMLFQNFTSHDRSNRSAAYDFAVSNVKNLPKNSILFVVADNDTYPLWSLQETNEYRTDIKIINTTLAGTAWNAVQLKRKTNASPPIPSSLSKEFYGEGKNEQVYVMSKEDWANIFKNMESQGVNFSELSEFTKFLTQDSLTAKEAVDFLKYTSPQKDTILKMIFGEKDLSSFNILPVQKIIVPVNIPNAVASGSITAEEARNALPNLVIDYKSNVMTKSGIIMLDILANNDWRQAISVSAGAVYDPSGMLFLQDYLQFDGFTYSLVPFKTPRAETGEFGRVNAQKLYQSVKGFQWGGLENKKTHFDETGISNIYGYRLSASRAAEALVKAGDPAKALEVLNLVQKMIPSDKYADAKSLGGIINAYILVGQEQKALSLAKKLQNDIWKEYQYFKNLPDDTRQYVGKDMEMKPLEYSIVVSAVVDAYRLKGKNNEAYSYAIKALEPVDKEFKKFITDLKNSPQEKRYEKSINAGEITSFYQYLFGVMDGFDSTYSKEKRAQLERDIIQAAK